MALRDTRWHLLQSITVSELETKIQFDRYTGVL
jgi:hypothetical protein